MWSTRDNSAFFSTRMDWTRWSRFIQTKSTSFLLSFPTLGDVWLLALNVFDIEIERFDWIGFLFLKKHLSDVEKLFSAVFNRCFAGNYKRSTTLTYVFFGEFFMKSLNGWRILSDNSFWFTTCVDDFPIFHLPVIVKKHEHMILWHLKKECEGATKLRVKS